MNVFDEAKALIETRPGLAREIARQMRVRRRSDAPVGLTSKQKETLEFIIAYANGHDELTPTYDEIKDALGLRSKSGVFRLIVALEERGYIVRMHNRHRSLALKVTP